MAASANNIWYRAYHGMVSDDKWPLIARKSGQSVAVVVAVWTALLECASQAQERGSIEGFDPESMNVMLGLDDGVCEAILEALCSGKTPRIANGEIVSWDKRQPKRERDDYSGDRVRRYREKKRLEQAVEGKEEDRLAYQDEHDETPCNECVTTSNAQRRREEKRGEDKKNRGGESRSAVERFPGKSPTRENCDEEFNDFVNRLRMVNISWGRTQLNNFEYEAALRSYNGVKLTDRDFELLTDYCRSTLKEDSRGVMFLRPLKREKLFENLGDWLAHAERWAREERWKSRVVVKPKQESVFSTNEEDVATEEEIERFLSEHRKKTD